MSIPGSVTQEQIRNMPANMQAAIKEASERALKLSQEEYRRYPRGRIAPMQPDTTRSIGLSQRTGAYAPGFNASRAFAQTAQEEIPGGYQEYLDPNSQAILDSISRQGERAYKEKIMPELDARFIRLGQHGSSKHGRLARKAARDIQKEISAQQEDALSRNYQQAVQAFDVDRARSLEAANLMTKLGLSQQAGQLADIQHLRELGSALQEDDQRALDLAYERWKEEQLHPYTRLSQYLSLLSGVPYMPSVLERTEEARPTQASRPFWRDLGINILGDFLTGRSGR